MTTEYDVANAWAAALEDDLELAAFCTTRFGKAASVSLGITFTQPLGEADAPYLCVIPFRRSDGFEERFAVPQVVVTYGLVDSTLETFGTRGARARGWESLDLFESQVLRVLGQTDFIPSRWEGDNDQPGRHFFIRHINFTCDIPRTI